MSRSSGRADGRPRIVITDMGVVTPVGNDVPSAWEALLAGRSGGFPPHIRRIGVPLFQNESTIPDLDRIITEAVRRELRSKGGRYVIVADSTGVDAVLTGTLRPLTSAVGSLTDQRLQASLRITLEAMVEFKDVKDTKVICCPSPVSEVEEFDVRGSTTVNDPSALFSQDANALERMAREFARTLVAQLLDAYP